MPWELYIHHIDVGQGHSTLIVARNPGPPVQQRSLLFDGGRANVANLVHNYVVANLFGQTLNRIVTSHYDIDHSGGITELLIADNRYVQNRIIAEAAGAAAFAASTSPVNNGLLNQIGAAAAAAAAACRGGYNDPAGNNHSPVAVNAGQQGQNDVSAALAVNAGLGNLQAAEIGFQAGENTATNAAAANLNRSLVPSNVSRRNVATHAGITAGVAGGNAAARTNVAYPTVDLMLLNTTSINSRFNTNGLYNTANIIDVGETQVQSPDRYRRAIQGRFVTVGGNEITVPGVNRLRTIPPLGAEILWNTGNNAQAPPANAPAVFVVARNRYVRNAPPHAVPIGGDPRNNVSIGLIIRFNNFSYYTGGDLPSQGEDLIVNDILANGLPNPLPVPNHICCFQCGHHGSATSSSQHFINNLHARAAFISTGGTMFEHPDQVVINRLHNNIDIQRFYLTNCNLLTNHVPATQGHNQLTTVGNKSRVAGDNLAAGPHGGNILVKVNEAESTSNYHFPAPLPGANAVYHRFRVRYWEEDEPGGANFRTETHNH